MTGALLPPSFNEKTGSTSSGNGSPARVSRPNSMVEIFILATSKATVAKSRPSESDFSAFLASSSLARIICMTRRDS